MYYNILRRTKFSCGKFQWYVFVIMLASMNGFGYINLGLGYYELMPVFNCVINGITVENCSNTVICAGESTP